MPDASGPGDGNPGIVPPYLLDRIAEGTERSERSEGVDPRAAEAARRTRELDDERRRQRGDRAEG